MKSRYLCGRTPPRRDAAAAAEFKRGLDHLWGSDPRVKPIYKQFVKSSRTTNDGTTFHLLGRPLPPVRLLDGTCPFEILPIEGGGNLFGGTRPLNGPADPLLGALWRECLAARPMASLLSLRIDPPNSLANVYLGLRIVCERKAITSSLNLVGDVRSTEPGGMRVLLEAIGAGGLSPREGSLDNPSTSNPTRSFVFPEVPIDVDWPARIAAGLERLGWDASGPGDEVSLTMKTYSETYEAIRTRLNAVAGGWNSEFEGWYRQGFDPFTPPRRPRPGEEYRYPASAYVKRNSADGPTVQVDVVHDPSGTYLEFLTTESVRRLRHYAELAGFELELWEGAFEDRWG